MLKGFCFRLFFCSELKVRLRHFDKGDAALTAYTYGLCENDRSSITNMGCGGVHVCSASLLPVRALRMFFLENTFCLQYSF